MNRYFLKAIICASLVSFAISCAVEKDEDTSVVNDRYIQAYMEKYYPGVEPDKDGIYVISHETDGTGPAVSENKSSYILVRYSTRTMDGRYTYSCYDTVARIVGTYSKATYYGPLVWSYGRNVQAVGIEKVLFKMREKDKISALIPNALLQKTANGTKISTSDANPLIYDIQIDSIITDIDMYEFSLMRKFATNFENNDPVSGNKAFISMLKSTNDTIEDYDYIKVRYVGKLLNGFVFDTNIPDTAKKYGLYDSSNEYEELDVKFHTDSSTIMLNNSLITGFALAISKMKYGEKAITFFDSDYGYGSAGTLNSSGQIPPYSPLAFEIWIADKPEEEE